MIFFTPPLIFLIITSYNLLKYKLNFWFLVQQKNSEAITSNFARKAEPSMHQHPFLEDLHQRFETTKQIAAPKTRDGASLFASSRIPQLMPVWKAYLNLWAWSIRNYEGGGAVQDAPHTFKVFPASELPAEGEGTWLQLSPPNTVFRWRKCRSWSLGGRKTDNSYLLQKCQNESTGNNFSHSVSVGFL